VAATDNPNSNLTSIVYTVSDCRDDYLLSVKEITEGSPQMPGVPEPFSTTYVEGVQSIMEYHLVYTVVDPATGNKVNS